MPLPMLISTMLGLDSDMKEQTFARNLWLSILPSLVGLTVIPGADVWLLRQVHQTSPVPCLRGSARGNLLGQPLPGRMPEDDRERGV
jgi:hypothetical protein